MANHFVIDETQLNRLFPFYILVNKDIKVMSVGKSMEKLCSLKKNDSFTSLFSLVRPNTVLDNYETLKTLKNQLVILETNTTEKITIRGQFEWMPESDEILFVGSPWFSSMEDVRAKNMVIGDFANHDSLIDLLHVVKSQEITTQDLKELIATTSSQKKELQKANKENHDIALFPMQNPDPNIRINFAGEVLKNNPAAARLDFFEYEKKIYRNDDFFLLLAQKIDKSNPRWIIEAKSDDQDYSFACVTMLEEGYINIYGRNITQQKKDQQLLERISLVASANNHGVLFTTPEGQITWANEGFCKLTGYTNEEVIGKSPIELCRGPLTDEASLTKLLESFFKGEGFNVEIIYYRKDKTWFWGRSVSQPIWNKDGKLVEFFGIIEDVTDEKISKEKLKILSQIAENNSNAVIITDSQGLITWVNKSFVEISGYNLQEVVGKKPGNLLQGPETNQKTIQYLRTQVNAGEPFNTEILNYSKGGTKYWLRIKGQPIKNEQGEVTGFFALEEDITKEKETEDRFRKALENIGDNVWEHDFKTSKTYFSKTDNEILGCKTDDLTNNQELWWKSVYPEDKFLLLENDLRYRHGEISSHSLEYRIIHADGNMRWVLDRGVVIEKDRDGRPLRITGTHTDITNQKKLEKDLIKSREQAELLAKAKETFLANMSHEMRTPMNAIIGMGNQLTKTKLTDQQNFYLSIINQAAENLLVIINDILDLSKIEAGKLSIEKIGFRPKQVINNAMQVVMHKAEEKGLQLTSSCFDEQISPVLIGDPFRLNQVLLNLLSNAIKFTEKGYVDIICEVKESSNTTQTIQFKVVDTGIGMEEVFVDRLFDKFSQESDSTTRKYGGTGLGMSICKELIELMKGHIEVSSEKGKGTTVIISISFDKGTAADISEPVTEIVSNDILIGKNILVTDDNDMNRLVASTILKNHGASILEATNGEEALNIQNEQEVDLILMDIHMPVLNGLEATQEIRKRNTEVPIIALTANTVKGENERCMRAGMNDYIAKPFKEEEFLEKIAYWLHRQPPDTSEKKIKTDQVNKLYDLSGLHEISRGDHRFILKMVDLFCEQSKQMVEQMKTLYAAGKAKEIGELAHKLKPSIDSLKIHLLEQIIRDIEKAGKEGQLSTALEEKIAYTHATIHEVIEEMRKEYPKVAEE